MILKSSHFLHIGHSWFERIRPQRGRIFVKSNNHITTRLQRGRTPIANLQRTQGDNVPYTLFEKAPKDMFDPAGVENNYRKFFNYKYVTPLGSWGYLFTKMLHTLDPVTLVPPL
jgi:hypothetical protein